MRLHKNKFLTTVAAAALALAVGACSSSSDDDEPLAVAPPPPGGMPPPPPPAAESDVIQVGEDDATAVTTVRDSDGDLKGIKVGEKEVSTILFAQNKGRVGADSTDIGIVAQMEDIVARHVETYANMRPAMGTRHDVARTEITRHPGDEPGGRSLQRGRCGFGRCHRSASRCLAGKGRWMEISRSWRQRAMSQDANR